ncbi:MAG TPA: DUF4339 domain-containing protein [Verrucomicrobiae bacterium]|nr:DUF4339 domain-containing protein [Verrucomicrobiae bacterium]
MANYTIIGGDGKQYGPITDTDVRKWFAEGRLNAQTMMKEESDAEFRPLSAFPEFAGLFQIAPPPAFATGAVPREQALRMVKGPAIALVVTAIIGLLCVAIGFVINISALMGHPLVPQQQLPDQQMQKFFNSFGGGVGIIQDVIGAVVGVIVLIGAGKMQRLESFQFAMTAAIVAMIPCISPCCFLGLPFGIWALTVLNKPEVKSNFS